MTLHVALMRGDYAQVRHIIESGVDVNERDGEGRTPLMLCSFHDGESWALGVARMLLAHSARVGWKDLCGRSALTYAILYKRRALVQLLLQALDYDIRGKDCEGHDALWYASRTGDENVLKMVVLGFKRYDSRREAKVVYPIMWPSVRKATHLTNCKVDNQIHKQLTSEEDVSKLFVSVPHKTLPADLWTQRETISNGVRLYVQGSTCAFLPRQRNYPKRSLMRTSKGKDWRNCVLRLTGQLEEQLSASYRPKAQPQPRVRKPPRILPKKGAGSLEASMRQQCQRGRKLSLGAIDTLMVDNQRGDRRRRCSVAVIPMTRTQTTRRQPHLPLVENLKLND